MQPPYENSNIQLSNDVFFSSYYAKHAQKFEYSFKIQNFRNYDTTGGDTSHDGLWGADPYSSTRDCLYALFHFIHALEEIIIIAFIVILTETDRETKLICESHALQ